MRVSILKLKPADAPYLAKLCTELGYPSTPEQCFARVSRLQDRSDQTMLGASEGNEVIGFVHVRLNDSLEVDRQAEIASLVVLEKYRKQGIGKLLMKAAEEWARGKAERVVLRSRIQRTEAHAFYQSLGYSIEKTSYTLGKTLS